MLDNLLNPAQIKEILKEFEKKTKNLFCTKSEAKTIHEALASLEIRVKTLEDAYKEDHPEEEQNP